MALNPEASARDDHEEDGEHEDEPPPPPPPLASPSPPRAGGGPEREWQEARAGEGVTPGRLALREGDRVEVL